MSKLAFQFHALPSELDELFGVLIRDETVHCVIASHNGSTYSEFDRSGNLRPTESDRALIFSIDPPNLAVRRFDEFRLRNPDAFFVEIGNVRNGTLAESWAWAMTEDSAAMKRWRQAVRIAKSRMLSGAETENPITGAKAFAKSRRFTHGAFAAYSAGIRIAPTAGNTIIRLRDPRAGDVG